MVWEIWYYDVDNKKHMIYVIANSFDEAIAKARKEDMRYDSGVPIF